MSRRTCSLCDRPVHGRGLCHAHYSAARRSGTLPPLPTQRPAPACHNCRRSPAKSRGRCNCCATYYYQHGEERPVSLILKHLDRQDRMAQRAADNAALAELIRDRNPDIPERHVRQLISSVEWEAGPLDTPCLAWQGGCDSNGYAQLNLSREHIRAHRLTYIWLIGPIPPGLVIDHLCRNRRCCNPLHLEPVTDRTNTLRGDSPGARAARTNACLKGHPYTPENTYVRPDGRGRQCITCRRERGRRYAA